jgi:hypothetical protein
VAGGTPLTDTYFVQIDLVRLGAHLARSIGRPIDDNELREWLVECGFEPAEGGFVAEALSVEALTPDEIISQRII